jgi:hypothetical protein
MRALLRLLVTVVLVVVVAALAIFAVENTQVVRATFVGQGFTSTLWWLVVGGAILGFVLAAILVTPGWISAGWRGRILRRASWQRGQELETLRRDHEHLQAEHERLLAEHRQALAERDRLRTSVARPVGVATAPAATAVQPPAAGTTTTVYSTNEAPPANQPAASTPLAPQPQASRRQEEWNPNGQAAPTA